MPKNRTPRGEGESKDTPYTVSDKQLTSQLTALINRREELDDDESSSVAVTSARAREARISSRRDSARNLAEIVLKQLRGEGTRAPISLSERSQLT